MSVSNPRAARLPIVAALLALVLAGCASTGGRAPGDAVAQKLMAHYGTWHGTPYRYGGGTRRGVDCSGFVQATMRGVFGVQVPRSTEDQARAGRRVGRGSLTSGDLVFFKTGWFKYHVGVYVRDGRFIHASESRGVIESSLSSPYWSKRFWKARRIV
ncbi:MAG: peptidase P60 [Proteobacteria bacterium]|nr:MAG: peptidase P60 [Pseudomonadota bacterium]